MNAICFECENGVCIWWCSCGVEKSTTPTENIKGWKGKSLVLLWNNFPKVIVLLFCEIIKPKDFHLWTRCILSAIEARAFFTVSVPHNSVDSFFEGEFYCSPLKANESVVNENKNTPRLLARIKVSPSALNYLKSSLLCKSWNK